MKRRANSSISLAMSVESMETRQLLTAYTITDLGSLGSSTLRPTDINAADEIVGYAQASDGTAQGFVYQNGAAQALPTFGGTNTYAQAINSSGVIVGYSDNAQGNNHAFRYSNGTMTDLGTLGGTTSRANGINDNGVIVGSSANSAGVTKAFVYDANQMVALPTFLNSNSADDGANANDVNNSRTIVGGAVPDLNNSAVTHGFVISPDSNGALTDLGTFGGLTTYFAYRLNNAGDIIGIALDSQTQAHAFLDHNGVLTEVKELGGTFIFPEDINDSGQVVGEARDSLNILRGYLYQNGTTVTIDSLLPSGSGWQITGADAINDAGDIVGTGVNPAGQTTAFLMKPVDDTPVASPLTAKLTAATLKKSVSAYTFTVTYTSTSKIDTSSLDVHDTTITGANNYRASASVVGFVSSNSGKTVVATYRVRTTFAKWKKANNGTYHVYVRANQVSDIAGNFADLAVLGYFKVAIG